MKQRKLNKRKGFTLVELLVVIAILAVLATVSVVGYTSFTKKAKVSNDKSLVSQLNLALDADETLNGKAATPTDALKATREAGYVVEKLTPTTSKYNIVWNQEKNEFALLDEENKVVFGEVSKDLYKNWKFADTYEKDGYSVYLNSGYTGSNLEVSTGLDVGKNEGLNVSYAKDDTAKDVVIRTNGGTLEVNADTDTVYHYGSSSKVTITAVAGNSYHENGTIEEIELTAGHVVVETGSVNTIRVVSEDASNVSIDVKENANVNTIAATNETVATDLNNIVKNTSKNETTIITKKVGALPAFAVSGLGTKESPYIWMGAGANKEKLTGVDNKGSSSKKTLEDWIKIYAEYSSLYIKMGCNVDVNTPNSNYVFTIDDNGELHFDLAGYTLNVTAKIAVFNVYGYTLNQTATLELNDSIGSGKVNFSATSTSSICVGIVNAYTRSLNGVGSKVVINAGTYEVVSTKFNGPSLAVVGYGEEKEINGVMNSGTIDIEINGGTFKTCTCADGSGNSTILLASKNENSKITINGGYFETAGEFANKSFVLNMQDGWAGKILVNGGTYRNYIPGETDTGKDDQIIVNEYYKVVDNQDNTWSVVKK